MPQLNRNSWKWLVVGLTILGLALLVAYSVLNFQTRGHYRAPSIGLSRDQALGSIRIHTPGGCLSPTAIRVSGFGDGSTWEVTAARTTDGDGDEAGSVVVIGTPPQGFTGPRLTSPGLSSDVHVSIETTSGLTLFGGGSVADIPSDGRILLFGSEASPESIEKSAASYCSKIWLDGLSKIAGILSLLFIAAGVLGWVLFRRNRKAHRG